MDECPACGSEVGHSVMPGGAMCPVHLRAELARVTAERDRLKRAGSEADDYTNYLLHKAERERDEARAHVAKLEALAEAIRAAERNAWAGSDERGFIARLPADDMAKVCRALDALDAEPDHG